MKLYGFFRSSAAFRVRIALNIKGLPYDAASIHLRRNDQARPEYRDVNPQGLVPALEVDGHTLIQSLAIIEYLDETHPEPPLLPPTPADRARVRALAEIVACDIHPINNLRVLRYLTRTYGRDETAIGAWYNHWIDAGFQAVEALLARDPRTGVFCPRRPARPRRHRAGSAGRQRRALQARHGSLSDDHPDFRELHEAAAISGRPSGQSAGQRALSGLLLACVGDHGFQRVEVHSSRNHLVADNKGRGAVDIERVSELHIGLDRLCDLGRGHVVLQLVDIEPDRRRRSW